MRILAFYKFSIFFFHENKIKCLNIQSTNSSDVFCGRITHSSSSHNILIFKNQHILFYLIKHQSLRPRRGHNEILTNQIRFFFNQKCIFVAQLPNATLHTFNIQLTGMISKFYKNEELLQLYDQKVHKLHYIKHKGSMVLVGEIKSVPPCRNVL